MALREITKPLNCTCAFYLLNGLPQHWDTCQVEVEARALENHVEDDRALFPTEEDLKHLLHVPEDFHG